MTNVTKVGFSLALALIIGLSSTTSAQAGKGKGQKRNGPLESIQYVIKQLDLTAEQQPKVDDIVAALEKKMQDLKADAKTGGDKDAAKTKAREILQDAHTQLEKVLTPDQQTKFRKLMAEERTERKEAAKDHKHPAAATQPAN